MRAPCHVAEPQSELRSVCLRSTGLKDTLVTLYWPPSRLELISTHSLLPSASEGVRPAGGTSRRAQGEKRAGGVCALPVPLGPSTALALPGSHRSPLLLGTQDGEGTVPSLVSAFILPAPAQPFRHHILFLSAFVSGTPVLLGLTQLQREATGTGELHTLPDWFLDIWASPTLWNNPLSSLCTI